MVSALLREGELDSVDLRIEAPAAGDQELVLVRLIARGELFAYWLCDATPPVSAEGCAEHLYDQLQDDIVESRFAWGSEPRHGDYVVPPPSG